MTAGDGLDELATADKLQTLRCRGRGRSMFRGDGESDG